MSTEHEESEPESDEKKSYSFIGRFMLFLFIAGPASVFAFGIYGRIGIRNAIAAAAERGDYSGMGILALWIFGLVGTATMIFKR
ncbi:hypothetical protein [Horticoccus sp. 23ND18S-11]|uniref:hypothetical protein n=1 Tax=Horticoccus sp. 23ND18S-11 TaxID=3391832 RepID=UPI0039C9A503